MKKILLWGFMLVFVMAMPQFINSATAKDKWKNYKLIKNGVLDESKWRFNSKDADDGEPIVTMDIVEDDEGNEYVKFQHRDGDGTDNQSIWLQAIKCDECVKGIQVEVTMGTEDDPDNIQLAGHFYARIGNVAGAYGSSGDYAWSQIGVRNREDVNGGDRVYGALTVLDQPNNYDFLFEPVYTQFNHREMVDGGTYLITMTVDQKKKTVTYAVDGYGTVTYGVPEKLNPGWENFWGIGTRTGNSESQGTVWFANKVKVLVDNKCKEDTKIPKVVHTVPEDNQRNVSVVIAGEQIEIKFNEAMSKWYTGCGEGEDCCPYVEVRDNETRDWILTDERFCDFDYKQPKSFVTTVPGDEENIDYYTWYRICVPKGYFSDLAGNGNKAACFKFRTERAPD